MNLKKIKDGIVKDSQGYPETLDELQDWGVNPETIIERYDEWASDEGKTGFMETLSEAHDLPESLDESVVDYVMHTVDDMRTAVKDLDAYLSPAEKDQFIGYVDTEEQFSAIV